MRVPKKVQVNLMGFFQQQNSQDLRQEVVGHIEATLNASAGEVGK